MSIPSVGSHVLARRSPRRSWAMVLVVLAAVVVGLVTPATSLGVGQPVVSWGSNTLSTAEGQTAQPVYWPTVVTVQAALLLRTSCASSTQ